MIPPLNLEPIEKIEPQKTKKTACFPFFGRKVKNESVTKCHRLTPRPQMHTNDIDLNRTINFRDLKSNQSDIAKPDWQAMPPK